jgi:hypothetical protein
MVSRLRLAQLLVCFISSTLPAMAQLDSAALRAKYGTPLNRETFHMPMGFDLVVDYGATNQVCRLQAPALMPTTEPISNASVMKQQMYAFLTDLLPSSLRGREIHRYIASMGALSVSVIEYEHLSLSEMQAGEPFSHDNIITVTFTNDVCRSVAAH